MSLPMSKYKRAVRVEASDQSVGGSLAALHRIAWVEQKPSSLLSADTVERDANRVDTSVHESRLVLRWDGGAKLLLDEYSVSSILIRDEYWRMIYDIFRHIVDTAKALGDENSAAEIEEVDPNDSPPFVNPFDSIPPPTSAVLGVNIVGSPGIGKSIFLIYVLALRLLARKFTVFQWTVDEFFVLSDEGVFRIPWPISVSELVPHLATGTWFLVDSDSDSKAITVPGEFPKLCYRCKGFILQAASPRSQHFEWTKKASGSRPLFWMAQWTLGELIAARDLQSVYKPSEVMLATFVERFGYSPRQAYGNAHIMHEYESTLNRVITQITRKKIQKLLKNAMGAEMDEISHSILVASPMPSNRMKYTLKICTDYVTSLVLKRLDEEESQAATWLCRLFMTYPITKASAGYLLGRAFLERFPNGGEWPVRLMKRSQTAGRLNTYWHFDGNAQVLSLRLGHDHRILTIANGPLEASDLTFHPLELDAFLGRGSEMKELFYVPQFSIQPTFDAFVYDVEQKKAIIFQVTVAPQYTVNAAGLQSLHDCGVRNLDLVVVTGPLGDGGARDIAVDNTYAQKIGNVYHLEFSP